MRNSLLGAGWCVAKLRKSVEICKNYCKKFTATFYGPQCIYTTFWLDLVGASTIRKLYSVECPFFISFMVTCQTELANKFLTPLLLAAGWDCSISDWLSVNRQTFLKLLLCSLFSDSHETWHMWCTCQNAKNAEQIFIILTLKFLKFCVWAQVSEAASGLTSYEWLHVSLPTSTNEVGYVIYSIVFVFVTVCQQDYCKLISWFSCKTWYCDWAYRWEIYVSFSWWFGSGYRFWITFQLPSALQNRAV